MSVEIYGAPNCSSCNTAKNMLDKWGLEYEYKCISVDANLVELAERVGNNFRTMPQIFIGGVHIGTLADLMDELQK